VFEPSVLALIEPGRRVSIERETFPVLVDAGTLYGLTTHDYWIDTGRPELYRQANLDLLGGRRTTERCDAVAPTARVDAAALVVGSIVGDAAAVGPGAKVTASVILPGAEIGAGAIVERSIVMGTVGREAVVVDAVLGAGAVVPDGHELIGARLPEPA
jgi:mannose-1-phosphate guanylyltransferase